jgi:hypothetical protein
MRNEVIMVGMDGFAWACRSALHRRVGGCFSVVQCTVSLHRQRRSRGDRSFVAVRVAHVDI